MSYNQNAASNHVPIFGVPGTVTVTGEGSARELDFISVAVSDGSDLVEHRDSAGMIVSRNHFNGDGGSPIANRSRTLTITAVPVGSDAADALANGAAIPLGTTFTVASSTVPGANGLWECTGYQSSGSNTDNVSVTITGVWAVTNT